MEQEFRLRLVAHAQGDVDGWLLYESGRGMPVSEDARRRRRVFLGKSHPYANSGGWQYLGRFLVMDALGRRLASHEHVHHRDGNRLADLLANLEVLIAELHGRTGAVAASLAGWRDDLGRFVEWADDLGPEELRRRCAEFDLARYGPIVGDAAVRLLSGRGGVDLRPDPPLFIPSASAVDRLFLGALAAAGGG